MRDHQCARLYAEVRAVRFALAERAVGLSLPALWLFVVTADCGCQAVTRLRPILMTTAAMVLGVLPLILASGAGAVSRFNMGLVIASGLTIGTLFTLFVVPAFYTMLATDHSGAADAGRSPASPGT